MQKVLDGFEGKREVPEVGKSHSKFYLSALQLNKLKLFRKAKMIFFLLGVFKSFYFS